jgi:hypothetical protein
MRNDPTTPDTRLADDPMKFNPATVGTLIEQMLGGLHPGHRGQVLHCRLRYFDPVRRRAGVPQDVAALVEQLADDAVTVTLVNVSPTAERVLIVQAGGYGEHHFGVLKAGDRQVLIDQPTFRVKLAPGCGARLQIAMQRYIHQPTLGHPWDRR